MDRAVFVYTTFPSLVEAEAAAHALVGQRLAACANILPGMISVYRWEGQLERGAEVAMILKTRSSLADALTGMLRELHPFDVPAIAVIPLEAVDAPYLQWLFGETQET